MLDRTHSRRVTAMTISRASPPRSTAWLTIRVLVIASAALLYGTTAGAAEPRVFLVTVADQFGFDGAPNVMEKIERDELRIRELFSDQVASDQLRMMKVKNNQKITEKMVTEAINEVAKENPTENDTVVFYYSGHGSYDAPRKQFLLDLSGRKTVYRAKLREQLLSLVPSRKLGIELRTEGGEVVVVKVEPNSPATKCIGSNGESVAIAVGDRIRRVNGQNPGSHRQTAEMINAAGPFVSLRVKSREAGREVDVLIKRGGPRLTVLLTDCCAAERATPPGPPDVPGPSRQTSPLFKSLFIDPTGIIDITSSTPPELSWVSSEYDTSIFTQALYQVCSRAKPQPLSWQELFEKTKRLTVEQSLREPSTKKQTPLLIGALMFRDAGLKSTVSRFEANWVTNLLADFPAEHQPQPVRIFGLAMKLLDDGTALVTEVTPDGPVAKAGIEPDDIILRWGTSGPFNDEDHLDRSVDRGPDRVVLSVLNHRDGKEYECVVTADHE